MTVFPYKNIMCVCVSYITIYETYEYGRYRKIYIYIYIGDIPAITYKNVCACMSSIYINIVFVYILITNSKEIFTFTFLYIHTYT